MKTTITAVLNSAAEFPMHRAKAGAGNPANMRCTEYRWLQQTGFGGGGRQQQRGEFSNGAVQP